MKNTALYLAAMLMLLSCSLTAAQPKIFSVATFGAVGDGKTDDRAAIQRAINAAVKAGKRAIVQFDSGKTYRLDRYEPAYGMLILSGAEGVTLDGNGATLLSHPANRILAIHASKQITVKNFFLARKMLMET